MGIPQLDFVCKSFVCDILAITPLESIFYFDIAQIYPNRINILRWPLMWLLGIRQ
jgi:hypothetical protein